MGLYLFPQPPSYIPAREQRPLGVVASCTNRERAVENDQTISILIHFIPCLVVLWILGLPSAVWEDLESFLPEPQEAKNRSCLRLFLSLGPLPKDFWVDERDCGLWAVTGEGLSFQISGVAQIFKFSHFRTRYLSPLGIKAVPPKNGQSICCFCCLCLGSLTIFQRKSLFQPD